MNLFAPLSFPWARSSLALGHLLAVFSGLALFFCPLIGVAQIPRSLELLQQAREAWLEGNVAKARELFSQVASTAEFPLHHREEAAEQLKILESKGREGFFATTSSVRRDIPELKPAVRFFVAPDGRDDNPGTPSEPFASLERARDAIRELTKQGLPDGGVAVVIRGGIYPVRRPLRLGPEDSGTPQAPICYQAAPGERPIFNGGIRLQNFKPVQNASLLARLPAEARSQVVQVNLRESGVGQLPPFQLGGFASGRGFRTYPIVELYWNKQPLPLARWPNQGFVQVAKVSEENTFTTWAGPGTKTGPIFFHDPRLKQWAEEPEVVLYGYWYFGWADSYEFVERIDPSTGAIFLKTPYSRYGYAAGRPFFALNLFCELDRAGEWYLDRKEMVLYLWPPGDLSSATVELSLFPEPMVIMENTSYVRFEGITWELGASDGIYVRGGSECIFAGCTIRCFAGNGVVFQEGESVAEGKPTRRPPQNCGLMSCDVHTMGRGGVVLTGGDRRTLLPGNNFVENCYIFNLSRIDHTYTPAVIVSGVGHRVAHNLVHDVGSSAFRVGGNEHTIEFNEVFRVVLESDDQGAVDMHGDPTFRGNVFRYNYWHHIGGWENPRESGALYRAGIRFDDAICGNVVYGNLFYRASVGRRGFGGIQIHGGKDNIIDNNLFVDCMAAISFSPWGADRWKESVSGRLERGDINRQIFLERYPELQRLTENPNANWIFRNVVAGCQQLFLRESRANYVGPNWTGPIEEAVVVERPGFFRLREDAPFWRTLGFRPIPLQHIGLYRDRFRPELPEEVVEAGRAGKPVLPSF
jgi:hypothetical protein